MLYENFVKHPQKPHCFIKTVKNVQKNELISKSAGEDYKIIEIKLYQTSLSSTA